MRDATALVPRVRLQLASGEVFAGFRSGGALSLYFGADPVYHFNGRGELRRAFVDDRLVKAEHGWLVTLVAQRHGASTELLRHELTAEEAEGFQRGFLANLGRLRTALETSQYFVVGQVPAESDILTRLTSFLAPILELRVAASPRFDL